MLPMKPFEKVLAGFEDNAAVVSGYLKDLPASACRERDGRWGCGRRMEDVVLIPFISHYLMANI